LPSLTLGSVGVGPLRCERAVSESPTTSSETILFVEDEALVRMDMAEFLRESGYVVYEAATAKEAIKACKRNSWTSCSPISICRTA
jgi:response regulator RpfG family c-di-GMP phosphodiesterase